VHDELLHAQDVVHHLLADDPGQEVVHDDPLVVPPDQPLDLLEQVVPAQRAVGRDGLHDGVVEPQHRAVQLGDQDVLVVAGVADQRTAGEDGPAVALPRLVARQVRARPAAGLEADLLAQPEAGQPGGLVVHVGLVGGAAAVHGVEVEARRPEVVQGVGVVLPLEARDRVERDVVVDELAQVGVPRRDRVVVLRRPGCGHPIGESGQGARLVLEDGQVPEHPPEPPTGERRRRQDVDPPVQPRVALGLGGRGVRRREVVGALDVIEVPGHGRALLRCRRRVSGRERPVPVGGSLGR
jgi:hypothetical protein